MFNETDLANFLIVVSVGLLSTTLLFATLWIRARERVLRMRLAQQNPEAVREDVTHIVQAVDAIAIEVERISEAQRFTALTLAERGGSRRVPERVITPH